MSNVVMAMEPIGNTVGTIRKPMKAFRGLRRKQIRILLRCLNTVQGQDARASFAGAAHGYIPTLFKKRDGDAVDNAMKRLIARCTEALGQTQ